MRVGLCFSVVVKVKVKWLEVEVIPRFVCFGPAFTGATTTYSFYFYFGTHIGEDISISNYIQPEERYRQHKKITNSRARLDSGTCEAAEE